MVEEKLHGAGVVAEVADDDLADVDVRVGVDGVVAAKAQSELGVLREDVGDDGVAQVGEVALPAVVLDPTAGAVGPDAEAEARSAVVLVPDVREVDVGEAVLRVEGDEQRSVADLNVTGHGERCLTQRR